MTVLRKRMLDELQRRNYSATTTQFYLRAVERFSRFFMPYVDLALPLVEPAEEQDKQIHASHRLSSLENLTISPSVVRFRVGMSSVWRASPPSARISCATRRGS